MSKSGTTWPSRTLLALCLAVAVSFNLLAAEEYYPSLTVGKDVYTNVTILNKTRTDLFFKHAHGMGNAKVKDLEPATQVGLGYQLEQPKQSKVDAIMQGPDLTQFESDPRVQELEARLAEQLTAFLDNVQPQVYYGAIAGIILLYLLFCYLCRCICVKTSNPPSPLIWLPFLKQIPLFKAAGMSGWWLFSVFVPPLYFVASIVWCFRIVRCRGKNTIFAIMLLFPVTNVIAFLYLALSGAGVGDDDAGRNVISLQPVTRRDAA